MRMTRWMTLLSMSVFLSGCGCGLLDGFLMAPSTAEPTPAPPPVNSEPPALYMLRGDIAFPMNRGSFCWGTAESSLCADVAVFPPAYSADEYTLVIGNTLELRFDTPLPDTVTAKLVSASNAIPDIPAEAVMDENGRILVTVPDDVSGDYALLVFATWTGDDGPQQGDASYAAPVRFEP